MNITLTNHAPVSIKEDDWPIIAVATGNEHKDVYGDVYGGEKSHKYNITVRQHSGDGRVIIYAVGQPNGGHLYDNIPISENNLPAYIRNVGEGCEVPDHIIQECIATLPVVDLKSLVSHSLRPKRARVADGRGLVANGS